MVCLYQVKLFNWGKADINEITWSFAFNILSTLCCPEVDNQRTPIRTNMARVMNKMELGSYYAQYIYSQIILL